MNDYMAILVKGAKSLGIRLTEKQINRFSLYLRQLIIVNKKFNLTSITEPKEIVIKHFLDSLSVLQTGYIAPGQKLLEIGAGAGLPGIAINIAITDLDLTMLEASKKKSVFLKQIVEKLELKNTNVINMRAEEFSKSAGRSRYDAVITRALSSLAVNLEYSIPVLKISGLYLAMKGSLAKEPPTDNACRELGCFLKETINIKVPYFDGERNIVVFQKEKETSKKYPRRTGVPVKRPL